MATALAFVQGHPSHMNLLAFQFTGQTNGIGRHSPHQVRPLARLACNGLLDFVPLAIIYVPLSTRASAVMPPRLRGQRGLLERRTIVPGHGVLFALPGVPPQPGEGVESPVPRFVE